MGKKVLNEVGKRYGLLTVIKETNEKRHRGFLWLCKCDCGKEVKVIGYSLRNGNQKSCGCQRYRKLPHGEAAFNNLVIGMKNNAKARGHEWCLTKGEVRKLTKSNCFYCGVAPGQVLRKKDLNGDYIYNGIDRVINDLGYVSGNVVPCCRDCNQAKHALTQADFKRLVVAIYNNWAGKIDIDDAADLKIAEALMNV